MRQGQPNQAPFRVVLERLFPRSCSLCGEIGSQEDPCTDCERSLGALLRGPACPRCAAPLMLAAGEAPPTAAGPALTPCAACLDHPPPFDRVVAPWSFAPPLSGLIHRMKYRRDLAAAAALGRLLAREVKSRPGATLLPSTVIGVPLSRRRLLQRGFNHAAELAAIVRRELGLGTTRGMRVARRHTPPQAKAKSVAERLANVEGAFTVRRWPANLRQIAIVDDVLTTGATASALAGALRNQGVERVEIWCCARTPLS